jgi:hypothetical protein
MTNSRRATLALIQLVFFAGLIALVFNYQFFLDQYVLATYKPSANVSVIESRISLTNYARGIFYRSDPHIDTKTEFNVDCQTKPGDLELGCYYRNHIYILLIDNQSLSPEMDVVTAHELLHASWERLSTNERRDLSIQLETVYAGIKDPDLRARMASYAQSEPGEEANELHSILATEMSVLTPKLEAYYARYFVDRQAIVGAHLKYTAVFDSQRKQLAAELATIRSLKAQLAVLNGRMESYKATDGVAQYNALVPKQNQLVDDINLRIDTYQKGVTEYNALSRTLDSQQITDTESGVQ